MQDPRFFLKGESLRSDIQMFACTARGEAIVPPKGYPALVSATMNFRSPSTDNISQISGYFIELSVYVGGPPWSKPIIFIDSRRNVCSSLKVAGLNSAT